jgi:hypothetical protein
MILPPCADIGLGCPLGKVGEKESIEYSNYTDQHTRRCSLKHKPIDDAEDRNKAAHTQGN